MTIRPNGIHEPSESGQVVPLNSAQRAETLLRELFRLYEWRFELAKAEADPAHDKKQMKSWLVKYGREKKAAWDATRELFAGMP